MRKRYISIDGHWVPYEEAVKRLPASHMVQPEIAPYRSMVDGSVIESRSKHREHLRKHGMREVDPSEVAPERIATYQPNYDADPQGRRELIAAQLRDMRHEDFRKALARDIDRIKWNSRSN